MDLSQLDRAEAADHNIIGEHFKDPITSNTNTPTKSLEKIPTVIGAHIAQSLPFRDELTEISEKDSVL